MRAPCARPAACPAGRLAAGLAGLALAGAAVRRQAVGPAELEVFRAVNRLPDAVSVPIWVVMQGGNLAAAPVAAAVAAACGRPVLARRLLATGTGAWVMSKVVKRAFGRPRPASLVSGARHRGRAPTGLGFVSGHAAVSTGLCAALLPGMPPGGRRLALAGTAAVGLARMYVGAHLPLDVAGGAALGLAVEAVVELAGG